MIFTQHYYNFFSLSNFKILAVLTVFTLVCIKITSGISTYQKTLYLLLFLMYMGLTLGTLNFNFLVPIYFAIELGTIIFILIVLRSNTSLFSLDTSTSRVGSIFLLIVLVPMLYFNNLNIFVKETGSIFLDFYSKNASKNDFFGIYTATITSNYAVMVATLVHVFTLTVGVISFKLFKNFPKNILEVRLFLKNFNIFQKNKELYFYTKKNIITFFK